MVSSNAYFKMHACSIYKHAVVAAFSILLSVVKMPLKGEVGGQYLIVMGIILLIMENHGIVFLNFCGNPVIFGICSGW